MPGVYLRLRMSDAASPETIRKAATASLRDGFNACLAQVPYTDPTAGPPCKASSDCSPGQICNETDHCGVPAQPMNLRVLYRGARVLGDDWSVALRSAGDDVKMRLLQREFDAAVKDDIPVAIDLITRAQSFLLVLDEPPEGAAANVAEDAIQAEPHFARVMLWGLRAPSDRPLLRLRVEARGNLVMSGGAAAQDPAVVAAQQRQVNNCALAQHVLAAVGGGARAGAAPSGSAP